jgi:cytochrome P450 family 6
MLSEALNVFLSILLPLSVSFIVALMTFVWWALHRNKYWKNLNVPYFPSTPFLGTFKDTLMGKISIYEATVKVYNNPFVKNLPYYGIFMFHKPALIITEPELIKRIMVKDFQHFQNRHTTSHHKTDPIGYYNLFMIKNPLWKQLRARLTPFFATGKMKAMFYLVDKINKNLIKHIDSVVVDQKTPEIELKEMNACYTTDVIASCAFGVEANSIENPNGEFREAGRQIFDFSKFRRGCEQSAFFMWPETVPIFNFKLFSEKGCQFIKRMFTFVLNEREKSGEKRNDLIDAMLEIKKAQIVTTKNEKGDLVFDDDVLTSQAGVFFTAG